MWYLEKLLKHTVPRLAPLPSLVRFRRRLAAQNQTNLPDLEQLRPHSPLVFTVHEDGRRTYPLLSAVKLEAQCQRLLQTIEFMTLFKRNEWENGIKPFLNGMLQLMGALPASEGVHDFHSGGLFRHSSRVCLRALRSYKEELMTSNFYNEAQARLMQAAIILQAYAHDLGKLLSDFTVKGEDELSWDPRQESFYAFASQHCQSCYYLSFHEGRGISHKERKALALSLMMPYLPEFMRLCQNLTDDPEAILDGTVDVKGYIAKADSFDVADQSPLRTKELYVPDYLRARLGQKLYSGQFKVNEAQNSCYVTDIGLLVPQNGAVHRFLVETFDLLVDQNEKEINDTFINYCKPKGFLLLSGERAVYSWYLVRLKAEVLFVYGMVLRCDFRLRYDSCYCRHLGNGQPHLAAILEYFEEEKLRISCFKVREEKQAAANYQPEDLLAYETEGTTFLQERQSAANRRYKQKTRLKRTLQAEQEQLEELYRLCRPEQISTTDAPGREEEV